MKFIDGNRAPRYDGHNFYLVKTYWSILEPNALRLFYCFLLFMELGHCLLRAFRTLIPKSFSPIFTHNFLLIYLFTWVHTLVARVLASCLESVIDSAIAPTQMDFIRSHSVYDGRIMENQVSHLMQSQLVECSSSLILRKLFTVFVWISVGSSCAA